MKITTIIDKTKEEEIIICAHEKTKLINDIEMFVLENSTELVGYQEGVIKPITLNEIYSFNVFDNKVYACLENEKFMLKQRLYVIEAILNDNFVKINQSCIINIRKIKKFESSFGGVLAVILKNGYKDYISRRQLKVVKERIGL